MIDPHELVTNRSARRKPWVRADRPRDGFSALDLLVLHVDGTTPSCLLPSNPLKCAHVVLDQIE